MFRVYILSNYDLFGQGVMNLLRLEPEIEIVGQGAVFERALEEIKRLLPEAVIVESNDLIQDSLSNITHILETETPVKVICLNLQENKLHLYRGEQREARDVKDLVDAIKCQASASRQVA